MNALSLKRLRIISIGIFIVAFIFIAKLYILQVMHHREFVTLADKQYVKKSGTVFSRGSIYFEDKNNHLVSAATLKTGYVLTINPSVLKDPKTAYSKISAIVPIDFDEFMAKAAKAPDTYEEILNKIPEDKGRALQALGIKGVSLFKEQWRFYPGGSTAANVLGIMGYAGDDYAGRYGLEKEYQNVLVRNASDIYANFFVEVFSNFKKTVSKDAVFQGDIVATIEPSVQAALEDELSKITSKWQGDEVGGIIMDPKTGEIYGMAKTPTFNLNSFDKEKNVEVFSNPMVDKVYEMGSIVKPLTIAAGIDAGVITPKTTYMDKGYVTADTETIHNHDHQVNGLTNMQTVLNNSLNTGVAFVVEKLGGKKFANYMTAYGLGERTGIDLPNESQNIVSNLKSPRKIEYITASFGQGIAMTPISTIRALGALANGGAIVTPHVIKRINYEGGFFKNIDPKTGTQAISKSAADQITDMLVSVVDTALIGGKGKNPHYSVAAKTGTAQIAKPNGGGYYDDRYLHSFFGYFPAYKPRFIILLYVYNPKTNKFAADTLAQPFFDLSKFLINYYELPPDR